MVSRNANIDYANIPAAFHDLADCPRVAALTTVMPDGQPQTTVVWCNYDGTHVLVNTMRGFRKEKNMRLNPRVTLLAYDPHAPLRYLEVRGRVVAMSEAGALAHLDALSERYTGRSPYFGGCVPAALQEVETPVLCKILPQHIVTLDARRNERAGERSRQQDPAPASPLPDQQAPAGATRESRPVPATHLDLLTRPIHGVLTTMMADGQPQSSLVWCDYDGVYARINTSRERQKGRNIARNPRVTLLVVDPEDTGRYLEIRGEAALTEEDALSHLDALTRTYTRHPAFYGYVYPVEKQAEETRIVCRIRARRINLDAIHR